MRKIVEDGYLSGTRPLSLRPTLAAQVALGVIIRNDLWPAIPERNRAYLAVPFRAAAPRWAWKSRPYPSSFNTWIIPRCPNRLLPDHHGRLKAANHTKATRSTNDAAEHRVNCGQDGASAQLNRGGGNVRPALRASLRT